MSLGSTRPAGHAAGHAAGHVAAHAADPLTPDELAAAADVLGRVTAAFASRVVGQDRLRRALLVALMAEGRTNGSIAEVLVVSEAAVRKHVGNIFAKLDLDPASDRRVSAVLTYLRG